jgi:peptidyl-lysine (3S)-dioxygenase / protease
MGTFPSLAKTNVRQADSIVDGYFVEPHLRTVAFDEILDWLRQRQAGENGGSVRYVQSQNDNLNGEFINLREDVCELEWANEYFDDTPDACNIWIGNEESSTSYHLGEPALELS